MKLLFWSWPSYGNTREQEFAFRGMTGWVVGLIFWAYLGDENDGQQEQQDRMIAGAIRLPNRLWPALVFIFFVFLGTDSSIVLNLVASIIGFLYAKKRLSFLIPSDEKFLEYEGKTWLRTLTNSPNYVSIDSAGEGYLPIFIPTAYPPNSSTTSHNSNNSPRTPNSSFPGQGYRLDS
ncbi:hypothetical protein BDF20DRAFT_904646 [Mycotypha africana]|uniref:uncharacterized protein n=1 Tax=Mycotypha africana TaxID=64632 RepID=UPI002300508E|nr:uncharacterized protein BDF20DRAFT_904646 [Mycotypha africana]KAI8987634.1 hypothetical protein BDF20DRAFT_904646 [Mycotypha africana]